MLQLQSQWSSRAYGLLFSSPKLLCCPKISCSIVLCYFIRSVASLEVGFALLLLFRVKESLWSINLKAVKAVIKKSMKRIFISKTNYGTVVTITKWQGRKIFSKFIIFDSIMFASFTFLSDHPPTTFDFRHNSLHYRHNQSHCSTWCPSDGRGPRSSSSIAPRDRCRKGLAREQ